MTLNYLANTVAALALGLSSAQAATTSQPVGQILEKRAEDLVSIAKEQGKEVTGYLARAGNRIAFVCDCYPFESVLGMPMSPYMAGTAPQKTLLIVTPTNIMVDFGGKDKKFGEPDLINDMPFDTQDRHERSRYDATIKRVIEHLGGSSENKKSIEEKVSALASLMQHGKGKLINGHLMQTGKYFIFVTDEPFSQDANKPTESLLIATPGYFFVDNAGGRFKYGVLDRLNGDAVANTAATNSFYGKHLDRVLDQVRPHEAAQAAKSEETAEEELPPETKETFEIPRPPDFDEESWEVKRKKQEDPEPSPTPRKLKDS